MKCTESFFLAIVCAFSLLMVSCGVAQQQHGSDKCTFTMVLEGQEPLASYGLDSTKNWWAMTTPFTNMTKLYVNGKPTKPYQEIRRPIFSHDGNHWAAWAMMNNLWHVLLDGIEQPVQCTNIGMLVFSGVTQQLVYSYFDGTQEVVMNGQRRYAYIGRSSNVFVSPTAQHVAFTIGQTGLKSLVVDNKQTTAFDDILPIGFWNDGEFMYAARSGTQWRVYRGEEEVAGVFGNITEAACNLSGTACAVIASQGIGMVGILIGEEFTQPLISRVFDRLDGLALHPTQAIYGCRAMMNGAWLLVMNGAQYGSGQLTTGRPYFTHDGAELLQFSCDTDCGISINGKRTLLNMNLNPEIQYARKPKSETFAFTTASSLVFRKVEKNDLWVSYMCDETSLPRYNWRTSSYEALGRINQRLYFLSCKAF